MLPAFLLVVIVAIVLLSQPMCSTEHILTAAFEACQTDLHQISMCQYPIEQYKMSHSTKEGLKDSYLNLQRDISELFFLARYTLQTQGLLKNIIHLVVGVSFLKGQEFCIAEEE